MTSRTHALELAAAHFDSGAFRARLATAVAHPTESQEPERQAELGRYLDDFIAPYVASLGFTSRRLDNPVADKGPLLIAERIEDPTLPTLLSYGHGDVVRGDASRWREGLAPWTLVEQGERWYGRGTADNKGQHLLNLAALEQVIAARGGRLGYNVKLLLEMGEEIGSVGLRTFCQEQRQALAADLFIASDGPRVSASRPTLFLGARGTFNFDLHLDLREGGHHSGNWGGLLANPGIILAHALASLVDAQGQIQVAGLKPTELPAPVRRALADIEVGGAPGDPAIDPHWGEPGLTPAERVYGWNTFELLAFTTGNPEAPVNAIPGTARAHCQIRFVAGCDCTTFIPLIEAHLAERGFAAVRVTRAKDEILHASRLDPENPWVDWALTSLTHTLGEKPALLPNFGGGLPNDIFADILELPTLWVPHSYPACSQHAPNEHLLAPVVRQGLQLMAGLFWDLGDRWSRS